MSYLDESGLSAYDSNLKEWISSQESKTITSSIYPWTKTAKAGAVSCYPVGSTELKPVVNFLFTETPPVSGNKGPENPSVINGVNSVKVIRCGKNLCPTTILSQNYNDITVTVDSNGFFILNGTAKSNTAFVAYIFNDTSSTKIWPSFIKHNSTYTFSMYGDAQNTRFILYRTFNNGSSYGGASINMYCGETATWTTPPASETGMLMRLVVEAGTTLNNAKVGLQIEESSIATSFEPYVSTDYPLSLGNTYYGGNINFTTGVMTVTWEGVVFDGTEDWTPHPDSGGNFIAFVLQPFVPVTSPIYTGGIAPIENGVICSHFTNRTTAVEPNSFYIAGKNAARLVVKNNTDLYSDLPTFKTWLFQQYASGTPLSLVCGLSMPYTVQLSPTEILSLTQTDKYTPRFNTVYTDASSVQVSYIKSPIREEYELQQAIISQGGNI